MGLEGTGGERIIFMSSGKSLTSITGKKHHYICISFLDIQKAYDRVNRETLIYILDKLGFSTNICYLIKSMY